MFQYTRNVRAVNGASQVTGGGIISLGSFTLTVPATGTAALLGTSNIFTAVQLFPDGNATAPAMAFSAQSNLGFYRYGGNDLALAQGNSPSVLFSYANSVILNNGLSISWSSTSSAAGAVDLIIGRLSGDFFTLRGSSLTNSAAANILRHNTSGTPAAGFGNSIVIRGKSSTTNDQDMSSIVTTWVVATHASRTARTVFNVYDTAVREAMRIEASGSAPMVGFLGAAAVVRAAHIADPSGGGVIDAEARTAINAILVVLENLGFTATS